MVPFLLRKFENPPISDSHCLLCCSVMLTGLACPIGCLSFQTLRGYTWTLRIQKHIIEFSQLCLYRISQVTLFPAASIDKRWPFIECSREGVLIDLLITFAERGRHPCVQIWAIIPKRLCAQAGQPWALGRALGRGHQPEQLFRTGQTASLCSNS